MFLCETHLRPSDTSSYDAQIRGAVQSEQKVVSFLLQGGWILTLFEGRMWENDTLQKEHEDDTTTERSATDS